MTRILWIAPNLNHYKVWQLNKLSSQIEGLKVLYGLEEESSGHIMPENIEIHFDRVQVKSNKCIISLYFNACRKIFSELRQNNFKTVLMPMEKKNIFDILFLYILKFVFKFQLASYNHHYIDRRAQYNKIFSLLDRATVRTINRLYDIVIYYTEVGMRRSVDEKMVDKKKAFFANNTINVEHIFNITGNHEDIPENNILFIGRIISSKRVDILLEYFREIKKSLPDCKLFIIGSGPELDKYKKQSKGMKHIYWLGGIVEEEAISKYMANSKIVFVPGHSGLSIIHSFAYKKPYVTLQRKSHPPEIDYIENGKNGLILPADDKENNIKKIVNLLTDDVYYSTMSQNAYKTAQKMTLENWVMNMRKALKL